MPGAHPVYTRPEFADSSVPMPTVRPPPNRTPTRTGPSLHRGKTLTRPERGVPVAPLIKPPAPLAPGQATTQPLAESAFDTWSIFSHAVTFWAPPFLLSSLGNMHSKSVRQAWREKFALCLIALLLGGAVGFLTVGLDRTLCPDSDVDNTAHYVRIGTTPGTVGIYGWSFNISQSNPTNGVNFYDISSKLHGADVTNYFTRTQSDFPSCKGLSFKAATDNPCPNSNSNSNTSCLLDKVNQSTFNTLRISNTSLLIGFDWGQVANASNQFVLDGFVLDMTPYMTQHPTAVPNDPVDLAIRSLLKGSQTKSGKDATRLFYNSKELSSSVDCLIERYRVGSIDKLTPGCFISNLILYAGLIVILGLVMARWIMAVFFYWFLSARLVEPPKNLSRTVVSPSVMPEGANLNVNSVNGTAPWASKSAQRGGKGKLAKIGSSPSSTTLTSNSSSHTVGQTAPQQTISMTQIGAEVFAVCLVTCYSEGEDSLRTTLDSISNTTYSDSRKLLFVVADGMVTGAGEKMSTPDVCVGLLEADPRFGTPQPMSYIAVGTGAKKENRAMIYAGHYCKTGRRTPTVIIVKCGTDAEAMKDKKPGNRGKRDGQLILMNFFSRVTYNDRMTPLDFDLFRKIHTLMGVTPDYFEACLMVDADTKVLPDSLKLLVNCLHHDNLIMGLCGETRIANKRQSWVTAIQVYEYFISHHLAKAFESVFGGVTCLPGCFSMYRLKARKVTDDDWVPLIVHPDIIREYSQSEVSTLHQKNLLLLGEDRFLTTILLRTFPNRKMMFCPQARCRTVAPDTFSVLLSQRRRWINSTIHNLMELVQVRNLCGTFCFSMQFVVFMDLLGTVVLPVAICLTYSLIVNMALSPPNTFSKAIPLLLLIAVLGLPGILILVTTHKVVYIAWMFVYLLALPIWNFVLPVYSFWHFDDFSWGETRKVVGEQKDLGHGGDPEGEALSHVPLRRWEDWERSRLKKLRREEKRRQQLARNFPAGGYYDAEGYLRAEQDSTQSQFFENGSSDTTSVVSSVEEDKWGAQIGGYNENHPSFPPPPATLLQPQAEVLQNAHVVHMDELEAMLDQGFEPVQPQSYEPGVPAAPPLARHQLSERPFNSSSRTPGGVQHFDAFGPLSPNSSVRDTTPTRMRALSPPPSDGQYAIPPPLMTTPYGVTTATEEGKGHVRKRSGGGAASEEDYGPFGPLGNAKGVPNSRPSRI